MVRHREIACDATRKRPTSAEESQERLWDDNPPLRICSWNISGYQRRHTIPKDRVISYFAITFGGHVRELNPYLVLRNITIRYDTTQLTTLSGSGGQRLLHFAQSGLNSPYLLKCAT